MEKCQVVGDLLLAMLYKYIILATILGLARPSSRYMAYMPNYGYMFTNTVSSFSQ